MVLRGLVLSATEETGTTGGGSEGPCSLAGMPSIVADSPRAQSGLRGPTLLFYK